MKIDEFGPIQAENLMRQRVANACKRKATEDLYERPSKIIRREMNAEALQMYFFFMGRKMHSLYHRAANCPISLFRWAANDTVS